MSNPIHSIRVGWLDLLDLDTANPCLNLVAHCYSVEGTQMAGWGFCWSKRWADLSAARREALQSFRSVILTYAEQLARTYDRWLPSDAAITICLVQVGRYLDDGGIGVNVGFHRGEGREFMGQLALEKHGEVMTLNQRENLSQAETSTIVARLEQFLNMADRLAWRLRIDRI